MAKDFDDDGAKDLLLAGNFHGLNPQLGRHDASYGALLKGSRNATFNLPHSNDHAGNNGSGFIFVSMQESGLSLTGQVRDVISLRYRNKQEVIIFAKNDGWIQVYEMVDR
jgi:hypothetical protein